MQLLNEIKVDFIATITGVTIEQICFRRSSSYVDGNIEIE